MCTSSMLCTQLTGNCFEPRACLRRRRRALALDYDAIMRSESCFPYHLHMPDSAFCALLRQSLKLSTKEFRLVSDTRTCTRMSSKQGSDFNYHNTALSSRATCSIPQVIIPALRLTFWIYMRLLCRRFCLWGYLVTSCVGDSVYRVLFLTLYR